MLLTVSVPLSPETSTVPFAAEFGEVGSAANVFGFGEPPPEWPIS